MSLPTPTLTPNQVDVLAQVAEREHGTPPHPYARADLRAARALAVMGLLQHVDPDGDAREFTLTRAGADAYDQLPDDARGGGRVLADLNGRPYRSAHAALRDDQTDGGDDDGEQELERGGRHPTAGERGDRDRPTPPPRRGSAPADGRTCRRPTSPRRGRARRPRR